MWPMIGTVAMRMLYFLLVLCVVLFVWSLPSRAGGAECGNHDRVVALLGSKYKEFRHSIGLVSDRGIMEFFSSNETGTWTMLLTNPRGVACIVASGEAFHRVKPSKIIDPAT